MTQEQVLIQLFNELSNPTSPNIAQVTNNIQEFLKNPQSIFILFQIYSNNIDAKVRHYCLLFIRQYLHPISENVDKIESQNLAYLIPLKDTLLNMLVTEQFPQLKYAICDVIESYAKIIISISTWPEISQLTMNLIQNQTEPYITLYLICSFYSELSDEEKNALFLPYSAFAVNSLLSEIGDARLQAIDCLTFLVFELLDDGQINQIPNLMEILKTTSERAVFQYSNEDECARLFGYLFEAIFYDRFDQYNNFLPAFCEFALNVIRNPQIPLGIKIKCHQIMNEGPRVLPEYFTEKLDLYLSATLELSVIACESDREMTEYQFCDTFLSLLSSNSLDNDAFYGTFIQYINSIFQRNTPASIQVCLFALTCIVPSCSDAILEEPDMIVSITMKGIQSTDELILRSSNDLLSSLVKNASTCLSNYLDDIVKFYSTKLCDVQFLQTLSTLLAYSDHQPSTLKPLIQILIQMLISDNNQIKSFRPEIIQCLRNSISHADLDETIYQQISRPLIALANQDPSLLNDVFSCFGPLLNTSPSSIMSDVQTIMGIVFAKGSQNSGCAETLLAFIENLPISMAPFTQNTIQFCVSILSHNSTEFVNTHDVFEEYDGDTFDEKVNKIAKSNGAAIKMISYLSPNQAYLNYAIHLLGSISKTEQFDASTSVINAAQSLFQQKLDPSQLFSSLFSQLYEQNDPMIAAEMIKAINSLISAYPSRYILENAETISNLVINALNENIMCYEEAESKQSVSEKIMPPICNLFEHFVETIGVNFAKILPTFQDKLLNLSKGQNRNLRGYAILMMTRIAICLQSLDILQISLSSIIMNIKLKHIYLRINIFNAFRLILRNSQLWNQNQQLVQMINTIQAALHDVLMPILNSVVSGNTESKELFESVVALWSRCVIVFNWKDLSIQNEASIFSKLDTIVEDDEGKSIDSAELLLMNSASQEDWQIIAPFAVRIAIRILLQDDWNFARTPAQIINFAKNVVMSSGSQDVPRFILINVGYNERSRELVVNRLK